LFEEFADSGNNVEVARLFGPSEATRVAVLDKLINQRFDLLHYAGHCFYNADDPPRSGWLFSHEEVLSAHELGRIDRIPRFVFSNACESGITPDRADQRSAGLAPSFAEAFFARGVSNFICTAWPVDDAAALAFSLRVYRGLLGLLSSGAEPLHEAIKAARIEIATMGDGGRATWGAYQHYGDPHFRLGAPAGGARKNAPPAAKAPRSRKKK
jgi:CHAT domain-containing protein